MDNQELYKLVNEVKEVVTILATAELSDIGSHLSYNQYLRLGQIIQQWREADDEVS